MSISKIEAMFWDTLDDGRIKCKLCAHRCSIPEGNMGVCKVRENNGGTLYATSYGKVSSMGPDPIEKKPLFHFMPGSRAFSFGSVGCNFGCDFCQNYTISQEFGLRGLKNIKPEDVPKLAEKYKCQSISWTYNEPTIWYEFTLHGSKAAQLRGLKTSYVTNGYMTEEALKGIAPFLDAMNVDVKAFTEEFYQKYSRSKLQPVLDTCQLAKKLGIHIELSYLIIPTRNDDPLELRKFCGWALNELGDDVPIHFSAFHPDYKVLDLPRTPVKSLQKAHEIAKDVGLKFVYLGNIPHTDEENTFCPKCGIKVIERIGYHIIKNRVEDGKCGECGQDLNIVGR